MQQWPAQSERDCEKPKPHAPPSHTVPLPQPLAASQDQDGESKGKAAETLMVYSDAGKHSKPVHKANSPQKFERQKAKPYVFIKSRIHLTTHRKINLFAFCSSLSVFKQVFKVLLHVWVSVIRNCHHTPSLAERNPKWDSVINIPSSIKGLGIILINVYHTLIAPRAWFAGVSAFTYCPAPVMPNSFADWRVMKGARYPQQDLAYITLHRSSCSHRKIISFWFLMSHFTMCSRDCELSLCKTGNLEFWRIITALSFFPCSLFSSPEKQLFFTSFNKRS